MHTASSEGLLNLFPTDETGRRLEAHECADIIGKLLGGEAQATMTGSVRTTFSTDTGSPPIELTLVAAGEDGLPSDNLPTADKVLKHEEGVRALLGALVAVRPSSGLLVTDLCKLGVFARVAPPLIRRHYGGTALGQLDVTFYS